MLITSAQFITSASTLQQCPPQRYPEFAFFGRSNVGKSSLINKLTQRNSLAKASNTPWKTRLLNFFLINECWQMVDLPWYGYAKVHDKEKKSWLDTTQTFLTTRKSLKKVFLLIDISIPPQTIDKEMITTLVAEHVDFAIVFTKTDKASQKEQHTTITAYTTFFKKVCHFLPQVFLISNTSWKGRDELLNYIEELLGEEK